VPCHRVIGAKGALTGFGGGISVKQELLALEASHSAAQGHSVACTKSACF
jgi:methylated-DNA-[protein]-cysteine S-methyltransferase